MSHSMCPLLVGECVGLTKNDVLWDTTLVRYQQGYWLCIDKGVNTSFLRPSLISRTYACTYMHTPSTPRPLKQDDVYMAMPQCCLITCALNVIATIVYTHLGHGGLLGDLRHVTML